MLKSYVLKIFFILAITSAQCGVIIIIEDNNAIAQNPGIQKIEYDNEIPQDYNFNFHIDDTPDLPDPKNVALMARYIVHNANWTSVAYTSHTGKTSGLSMATLFAVSDGPVDKGYGVPYFYVSRLQAAVDDLLDVDNRCSLMMSLAETDICTKKGWDPEDPRCAHVIMSGTFHKLINKSQEYVTAAKSVFSRHPSFIHLPESHHFFLAKFNIESISIQDAFGGPSEVPISDYFKANDDAFQLAPNKYYTYEKQLDDEFAKDDFFSVFNI